MEGGVTVTVLIRHILYVIYIAPFIFTFNGTGYQFELLIFMLYLGCLSLYLK
jgi:hypothetical protein